MEGSGLEDSGFEVEGNSFRVRNLSFEITISGLRFRFSLFKFWVSGVGLWDSGSRFLQVSSGPLSTNLGTYPFSAEIMEPLARFVRKIPKDSSLADKGFPGLKNQEFLGPFSIDQSIRSA